jgi:transcriptional antiterminator RfaH
MSSEKSWRAYYTKPRHEKKSEKRLLERGFEAYCPVITERVKWSDRWKDVEKPLINGYIFVRVTPIEREEVLQDPGVLRCLFWKGKPALVRDEEIESLKLITEYGTDAQAEDLHPGQRAKVREGRLEGQKGTVIYTSGDEAVVLLESLRIQIKARISKRFLEKID